jgi:hypothetical protein
MRPPITSSYAIRESMELDPLEEPTRPDHIAIQQWRRLMSAFDGVPAEKRENFLELVVILGKVCQ